MSGHVADSERAYTLADRWAREVVQTEGLPTAAPGHFSLADEIGCEVVHLVETSEDFQEAAQWLIDRQQAELVEDGQGDVLILKDET